MNSNHRVNVVRIEEILPAPNADALGIVYIGGYQVVVRKDDYKVGELAVYLQPDSIAPQTKPFSFLWADKEFTDGNVPESKRRVTVRRFRKNWSEGLLLPFSEFPELEGIAQEGDDVSELLGVKHYEEIDPTYTLGTQGRKLTWWQRLLKFFGFRPKPFGPKDAPSVYDVESLKNYPRAIAEGEVVIATEKIHGSNARYYFDGKQFWVGSHKKWWKDKTNIFWRVAEKNPWIEAFCRDNPKHTLRGEVTPTQTGYQYGNTPEEQFFAFDVQRPDGSYMDKVDLYKMQGIFKLVPVVYEGDYDVMLLRQLAEGKSLVDGATNIREGLVISTVRERSMRGLGRVQLKLKSMAFLEKENKQK